MSNSGSPYLRYTLNDLTTNKAVNAALLVVLVLSAFLMATGAMVMDRMFGAVDRLFEQAMPPDFLQMHKGDYDRQQLGRFAAEHTEIQDWHIAQMVGFDSAAIAWSREPTAQSGDLASSFIDNLFVTQNESFDFLIDQNGQIPRLGQGEIYVPVAYQQQFELQVDDTISVRTDAGVHDMVVQGFVRDAQMASSLSSATRFLVSDADFVALASGGGGSAEIIVAYLLDDGVAPSEFQGAYEAAEYLPKNGPAVTYDQIRIINAFSDGLVAVALVFVSLLLVAIALLNARFVIRGTLADEVREIGAMKAIGIPSRQISRLYLAKYGAMTLLACVVGGALAIGATALLTRNVQANYAEAPVGLSTVGVPILALALVFGLVVFVCRRVLGAVKKIEVVGALVHGSILNDKQTARLAKRQARRVERTDLAAFKGSNLNRRLAWLDLRSDARQWMLIPAVFFIAAVLITLPMNLLSTFESPRFVNYMGAPESDVRADLQFSEEVDELRADILSAMAGDDRLSDVRVFANVLYQTDGEAGPEVLRVQVGDHSSDTVEYVRGEPPGAGQIALSVLNAEKFGATPGDSMTVRDGEEERSLDVSGVYQDVTNGGFTAKTAGEVTAGAAGYVIYADAVDRTDPAAIAAEYGEQFPAAAVIPMQEYVQQTLSYVTDAFRTAAIGSLVFGVGIAILITSLFLRLRMTSERRRMGVLCAIGFSADEIIAQIRGKTLVAVVVGAVLGLGFAATAGEALVGGAISLAGLGIADLRFIPDIALVYVAYPLILTAAGVVSAIALTAGIRRADPSRWLNA